VIANIVATWDPTKHEITGTWLGTGAGVFQLKLTTP
jgi:hypothetical protein